MSQENGPVPGLFSHDTIPIEVYTATDPSEAHHRPVFSAEDAPTSPQDPASGPTA
ncbi:hypothetical protein [Nocardia callitridis]|uniref:hypothetical protein n=1 Tax=Nocardia callitridis TaxID=648753 RepID=UPI0031E98C25